jgi:hypothetical protein
MVNVLFRSPASSLSGFSSAALVLSSVAVLVLACFFTACEEEAAPVNQIEPPPPDTLDCPVVDSVNHCGNICRGYPPIPDLGTGFFRGLQGGLYPGGQNSRPVDHNAAGLKLAGEIQPLDINGVPDSVSGKIVFLAVGMSNASQEFEKLQFMIDSLPSRNPYLEVVNGAQGMDITTIQNPDTVYWKNIDTFLLERGLRNPQVQVVWFKQAETRPMFNAPDTSFPGYADYLKEKFKDVIQIITDRFPNTKLCYVASRIYGGYDYLLGNPEPFAYYQGWAMKRLIEDQLNGDPALVYEGPNRQAPWLSWGTYLWADGLKVRSDGLIWVCPDDYAPDGRHPSDPTGRVKAAQVVFNFLTTDETAAIWLFGQ